MPREYFWVQKGSVTIRAAGRHQGLFPRRNHHGARQVDSHGVRPVAEIPPGTGSGVVNDCEVGDYPIQIFCAYPGPGHVSAGRDVPVQGRAPGFLDGNIFDHEKRKGVVDSILGMLDAFLREKRKRGRARGRRGPAAKSRSS
jgi:hypothetical protein